MSSTAAAGAEQSNVFRGKVIHAVLLGPRVELHIAVGKTELRAWTDSVRPDAFAPETSITVEFTPASAAWIC